jgi:predicted aspartyl protease
MIVARTKNSADELRAMILEEAVKHAVCPPDIDMKVRPDPWGPSMNGKLAVAALSLLVCTNDGIAQDSRSVCFSNSPPGAVIPACDDLIDADPKHAQAHQARGVAWYKVGDYERAIADFDASLAIDSKYTLALYNRALAREALGEFQEALQDLRTFAALNPAYPDTHEAIARVTKRLSAGRTGVNATPTNYSAQEIINMTAVGGVFVVPARFNNVITLNAIVDSGAADVSVPADIVLTLMRANTITEADFLGQQTYRLADGSTVPSHQFRIRSLRVGNKTIQNVVATVASVNAEILLGQSFLSRFKSWSIDNEKHALVLR